MSDFRSIVAEKELEWKAALSQQISLLEQTLASRQAELLEERQMCAQLKADFKYNLRLVQERDSELTGLERENALLKQQCLTLEDRLTAASVKLDEHDQALAAESHARAQLAERLQSAQDSHERELQLARHERDLEASRARDEQQSLRRQLEMEAARSHRELEVQKRELTGAFDRRADELQADYQERAAQMEKAAMDWELKCDMLARDNASLQKSRRDLLGRLEAGETEAAAMEKRLAESDARYGSDLAVLANEKERLQELLASLEVQHRSALERLEEKLTAAQAEAARRDQVAAAAAARQRQEKLAVRGQTAELVGKLHEAEASFQRRAIELEAALRAKDEAAKQLTEQAEELQAKLATSKADVGRLFADRDAEIDRLRRQLETAGEEAANRRADVDRYRRELESALERERQFEAARQQLEVDYQRRTGELEALQYAKSEGYIERLTQARNEALHQVEELQSTLAQKQTFIQSLLKDREAALQAMKAHGISLDRRMESKTVERDQLAECEARVRDLTGQNEALKEAVKQMRLEMESVGGAKLQPQPHQKSASAQPRPISDPPLSSAHEVSSALAKLRSERTDLLAQCRKQQARIGHLESLVDECQTEKTSADTAAEQLRYQLSAQERHHSTELAGLRRRIRELEAQLDESQREADEYYKANIEQGKLTERLQREALQLKSVVHRRPGEVNFGAQELYIQQLQDEIEALRERMRAKQLYGDDGEAADVSEEVGRLRAKLRMAAGQIKKLARENQSLVDLSNRLRAELTNSGTGVGVRKAQRVQQQRQVPPGGQPIELESHARRAVKDAVGGMTDRLRELERMQYYLTRDELARQNASARQQQQQQHQQQQHQAQAAAELGDSQPVKDTGGVGVKRAEGVAASRRAAAVGDSLNLSSVGGEGGGGGGESLREVWRLLDSSQQLPPTARNQALDSLRVGTHREAGGGYSDDEAD